MELVDALDMATDGFRHCLAQVDEAQWSGPTPCSEWDVRFLVAHVVGGNRFAALVFDGARAEDAFGAVMARRQLGDEPLVDYTSSADEQRNRFRAVGALAQTVSHPSGGLTGERFLEMRVLDVTLHTWDLARAISADDALDRDLAAAVLALVEGPLAATVIGTVPSGRVAPGTLGAPTQDRLLDATGRDRGWRPPVTSGRRPTDGRR
jgi:uncharacterized protein (TIGR03086 family)